jgi:hypothetical protein
MVNERLTGDITTETEIAHLAKEDRRQLLLSDSRIKTASSNPKEAKLCCGIKQLDEFLHGGFSFGTLIEWGAPFGNGARHLMASFLAVATGRPHYRASPLKDRSGGSDWPTNPTTNAPTDDLGGASKHWCLWVSARERFNPYPPAWRAAGVDLDRVRFAYTKAPIRDLRTLFIDDFFRVIVLDGPMQLTLDDCAFLSRHARLNRQIIVVIRDHLLSPSQHNVWARVRLNTTLDVTASNTMTAPKLSWLMSPIRGISSSQCLRVPVCFS